MSAEDYIHFEDWEQDNSYDRCYYGPPKDKPFELSGPNSKCPNCKSDMVRRKNKLKGIPFYGCSKYPKCKGTRSAVLVRQD